MAEDEAGPVAGEVLPAPLDVAVRGDDGSAVLEVRDTGAGIPADEMPRIWDRLFRGDSSRTERGLGLSYVISCGNEAALGLVDYLDFLVADPSTKAICLMLEDRVGIVGRRALRKK